MTILEAIQDPKVFRPWFRGGWFRDGIAPSWAPWITFLKVLFALPLDEDDVLTYERHTRRTIAPQAAFREGWVVVGRRGGKSLIASLVAVFLACFCDYSRYLAPGEMGTIALIAADRKQARTLLRYIRGFLAIPILADLVVNDTADSIELSNRITIEIHTASFRSTRGYTLIAVIADEIAFWRNDESSNPDTEIITAVRPGLATIPNSLLLCISSPYARRGALWTAYERHFGKDSPVLIWQASTRDMNPSIDQTLIDRALEEDEPAARAEYFAEFRRDVESFVSRESVEACRIPERYELPARSDVQYVAFVDPSGGSSDSMTLAIAHRAGDKAILDCIREVKPSFSPEAVVSEFCDVLNTYRLRQVTGDHYAGEWPRERFESHSVTYETSERTKSEIYLATLPMLNSQRCELLDNPRLITQLLNLERRTARGGRDSIDHAPGSHDDLINSAAGALLLAGDNSRRLGLYEYYKLEQAKLDAAKSAIQPADKCPSCSNVAVVRVPGTRQYRCNQCAHTWGEPNVTKQPNRKEALRNPFEVHLTLPWRKQQ